MPNPNKSIRSPVPHERDTVAAAEDSLVGAPQTMVQIILSLVKRTGQCTIATYRTAALGHGLFHFLGNCPSLSGFQQLLLDKLSTRSNSPSNLLSMSQRSPLAALKTLVERQESQRLLRSLVQLPNFIVGVRLSCARLMETALLSIKYALERPKLLLLYNVTFCCWNFCLPL